MKPVNVFSDKLVTGFELYHISVNVHHLIICRTMLEDLFSTPIGSNGMCKGTHQLHGLSKEEYSKVTSKLSC